MEEAISVAERGLRGEGKGCGMHRQHGDRLSTLWESGSGCQKPVGAVFHCVHRGRKIQFAQSDLIGALDS
jgi:hypothetical protein